MSRLKKQALLATVMLISFFVFFSGSSRGQVAETGECSKAQSHLITIGDNGQIINGCDPARMSKSKGNRIVWEAPKGHIIRINFLPKGGYPRPFLELSCSRDICRSGRINPGLNVPPGSRVFFEYTVTVTPPALKKKTAPKEMVTPKTSDPGAEIEP